MLRKMKLSSNQLYIIIFSIILCFQLINAFYWGTQKEGFMGDEVISYEFVCQPEYPWICYDRPYLNTWHTSEYYSDYFNISGEEAFDFKEVYDGLKSDTHPPLYYFFLHLMCCFLGWFTKWSGILLNIIFFIVSNIILYLMSRKLIKSKVIQLIPCLIYGFSVGAMSTVVLTRMYMQLTCVTLLFVYFNILLLDEVKRNKDVKKVVWFGIFVSTVFGVLTQYYFLIFTFFLCASIWFYIMAYGRKMIAIKYTLVMFGGIASSYIIWPSIYDHIFHGFRGNQAFDNLKEVSVFQYFDDYIKILDKEIFSGNMHLIISIILSLVILRIFMYLFEVKYSSEGVGRGSIYLTKKKKETLNIEIRETFFVWLFVFVALILDILVIAKIAPFRTNRYIFNMYPIMVLLLVIIMNSMCEWITQKNIMKIGCFAVIVTTTLSGYFLTGVDYLYEGTSKNIDISNSYSDLPVIFLTNNNRSYTSCSDAFYFQNGQSVYPIDETGIADVNNALETVDAKSFILYIDRTYADVGVQLNAVKSNVNALQSEYLYTTHVCDVYLITR